jgi:hypothetical protein
MDTNGEWVTGIEPGYMTKIMHYKDATIYVNKPILTPEQEAKRDAAIVEALSRFIPEMIRVENLRKEKTA